MMETCPQTYKGPPPAFQPSGEGSRASWKFRPAWAGQVLGTPHTAPNSQGFYNPPNPAREQTGPGSGAHVLRTGQELSSRELLRKGIVKSQADV